MILILFSHIRIETHIKSLWSRTIKATTKKRFRSTDLHLFLPIHAERKWLIEALKGINTGTCVITVFSILHNLKVLLRQ